MAHACWNLKEEYPEDNTELGVEYKSRVGDSNSKGSILDARFCE